MTPLKTLTQTVNNVQANIIILLASDGTKHYQIEIGKEIFLNGFGTEFKTSMEAEIQAIKSAKYHIEKNS